MAIRTDNITLRNLVFDLLFRKTPTFTANSEVFLAWVEMVELHDMGWEAFASAAFAAAYCAIHTRHIFRFKHQLAISYLGGVGRGAMTLAAIPAPEASFASGPPAVHRKIINGQVAPALGTSQGVTHNVFYYITVSRNPTR